MAKKILFLLLSVILGCLFPGQAAPTTRIRLSQSNVGLTVALLWVATRHGVFSKYGLDVGPEARESLPERPRDDAGEQLSAASAEIPGMSEVSV